MDYTQKIMTVNQNILMLLLFHIDERMITFQENSESVVTSGKKWIKLIINALLKPNNEFSMIKYIHRKTFSSNVCQLSKTSH